MTTTLNPVLSGVSPRADFEHPLVGLFAGMFPAYVKGNAEVRKMIEDMVSIFNDPKTSDDEKHAALDTLVEVLFPQSDGLGINLENATELCGSEATETEKVMNREEAAFSKKLRRLMLARKITQADLAKKTGVGQPAISMMLKRKCRPQRGTIEKIAEALGVKPKELWPTF